MNRTRLLRLLLLFAAAATVCAPGCLFVSELEYKITIDGNHATAVTVYRNVQSSNTDEQFDIDFNELIASWKGDQYVADRAKEGVTVTDRKLAVEKGVLVGRQTTTFTDESPGYRDFFVKDPVRLAFRASDIDTILHTNGNVRRERDSIAVTWRHGTKEMSLAMRFKLPNPGASFVPRFRKYLASQKN